MVLSPMNNQIVRGPTDFYLPTSLLDYKYEQDVTFNSATGTIVVYPNNFNV